MSGLLVNSMLKRIDATKQGIRVDLFSSDEDGQPEVKHVSGWVWEFPWWRYDIITYPNEIQQTRNKYFFTTKDGMEASVELSVMWKVANMQAGKLYKKYRYGPKELSINIVDRYSANACAMVGSRISASQLYANRDSIQRAIQYSLRTQLEEEFLMVNEILLIGKPGIPQKLKAAIEAKVEAEENANKINMQLLEVQAEAKKRIAKAKADSTVKVTNAQAEAIANQIISKSLTGQIIEKEKIRKWNGELPQFSGTSTPFISLTPKEK